MNKKKGKKRTTCLYIIGIPTTLKNYYKAYCAKKEITMSEEILTHMKDVTNMAQQLDKNKHEEDMLHNYPDM